MSQKYMLPLHALDYQETIQMQSVSQGFSEVAGPVTRLDDASVRGELVHVLARAVKQAPEQIA